MLQKIDQTTHIAGRSLIVREELARRESRGRPPESDGQIQGQQRPPEVTLDGLVFFVAAAFRGHPHINNVLTHISGANRDRVEQALRVILDSRAGSHDLSPLARNIVDLMCADRGVTGRILKPFYRALLMTFLGDRVASRLIAHVTCLFLEYEVAAQPIAAVDLTGTSAPTDSGGGQLMSAAASGAERVINFNGIELQYRNTIIFQLFEHLAAGDALQLIVDHDPKPLRYQLESKHGSRCLWKYLEEGPDVWRVRLQQAPG